MKTRGFEIVEGYETLGINLPQRQTMHSAGYDIEACERITIAPSEVKLVKTGIKAYMLNDEVLKIYTRSSMAVKRHAMLANNVGIIDADYYNNASNNGHILVPVYNFGSEMLIIDKGEKIAQCIFEKVLITDTDTPKDNIRQGGFGSSGK